MDNLIFCLNATVPIFAIILLGRLLRGRNFFSKQTLAEIDKLSFKVLLPILLFRDIAAGRITEQFNAKFFFFCAGVTAVYFFAIWAGAAIFLRDKSMVGAFTQGAFRGSQAILGVAFVQNLYGDAGLVPLMIVASVPLYNIFSVLVLTVTAPDARTADHHGVIRRTLRGIITNPIILGIFAGLPFSLLAIDFPPMLDKGLSMLGNCATPMALLSIGAGFEGAKAIKKLGPTCAAVFIKLVLLSAIFLPMGVALGFREQTLVAIVILCGAPSTASGYVMAKNMGGDITVTSEQGKGSTFTLTIHAPSVAEEVDDAFDEDDMPLPALNVLLVEDIELNVIVARSVLEKLGNSVDVAMTGKAALEMFKPGEYDLVLLDIQLPDMTGLDISRELTKRYPREDLPPLVALTANVLKVKQVYLNAGMDDVLSKPLSVPALSFSSLP